MNELLYKIVNVGTLQVRQITVENLSGYVEAVEAIYKDVAPKRKLFFRGHADYTWKLLPTVFRENYSEKQIALDYKQFLFQFGTKYDCYRHCDLMLGDMQHYGIPTRLLDWSIDPLCALFFAANEQENPYKRTVLQTSAEDELCEYEKTDGCVWVHNPWNWNSRIMGECRFMEMHPCAHDANLYARSLLSYNFDMETIKAFVHERFHSFDVEHLDITEPMDVVNPFTNERKRAQSGGFMIFGSRKCDLRENLEFCKDAIMIRIPYSAKKTILSELNNLNVNAFTVYPDRKGFAQVIKDFGSPFNLTKV